MATKTSTLIIKLLDQVSKPAKAAAASMRGLRGSVARFVDRTDALQERLRTMSGRNARNMDRLRLRLVDAAAGFYTLQKAIGAPISNAKNFQALMLDIAQKSDLTDKAMARLGARIRRFAGQAGSSPTDVAKGVDALTGFGLDPDRALQMMGPITKAAIAYRAQVDELARAGYAVFDNLKVPVGDFQKALNAMAQSGKDGAFELKDMAREFPALTAAAAALGMKGVKAVADLSAALQVARKGAGTSAEAANNVANLLQKIISPRTTKKFKKLGIDIRAEFKKAIASGKSPIEMIVEQTRQALKGDMSRLGDLFEDKQVQQALRPLIQAFDEYVKIRAKAAGAGNIIDADYARRTKTAAAALDRLKASIEQLSLSVGNALLPSLSQNAAVLAGIVQRVAELAGAFPQLTNAIVTAVTALIAFRIASIASAFAVANVRAAILTMATLAVATAGGIGRAFLALLSPIALVRGAINALKFALIGTGIGAILVGIGLAGTWIYRNWKGLGEFFSSFGQALMKAMGPAADAIKPVINAVKRIWEYLSWATGEVDGSGKRWKAWGEAAGTAVGTALKSVVDFTTKAMAAVQNLKLADIWNGLAAGGKTAVKAVIDAFSGFGAALHALAAKGAKAILSYDWAGLGKSIVKAIISGIGSMAAAFASSLSNMASAAAAKVRGLFSSGRPATISASGGAKPKAGLSDLSTPGRASGGPMAAGRAYRVGEQGPEIVTLGANGRAHPVEKNARGRTGRAISFAPSVTLNVVASGIDDVEAMVTRVKERLASEISDLMRSAYSDYGIEETG